jgi:hypothetical protein
MKLRMFLFLCFLLVFNGCSHTPPKQNDQKVSKLALPKSDTKKKMVLELVREMERVDGDGLSPRENRPESWTHTIARLSDESSKAENLYDLGRVFKRIDATYPNLHAKIYLVPELDEKKQEGAVVLPFKFYPEIVEREKAVSKYVVVVPKPGDKSLKNGDELVSINSTPIQKWAQENFIFCKFPQREQCEIEFFDNFKNELLGWNRHQALDLQVSRAGKILTVSVKPEIKLSQSSQDDENEDLPCGVSKERYKGFVLTYEGQNLCAFESKADRQTVAIRIKSFQYQNVPFAVLDGEVQIFWNNYWSKKSSSVKKLILDVIDNWGGQSPVPYYALFYSQPYQEQYVRFKKIAEFEQKDILESLFWGDKGKEIWFENIKRDGSFEKAKPGDFLDQIPQFCSSSKKDCREGLYQPRKNHFSGQVKILMNHWCISSCVGFVSNIKDLLKDKVKTFGIPDSGDSAYSRLSIFVSPLENGAVEAKIAPMKKARNPDKPEAWVRQVVSATRSTDKDGNLLSGKPQKIDYWVPKKWNQTDDEWAASVFSEALKH